MPSGLPISNNDPLSRRDAGLEFLDVTKNLRTELTGSEVGGQRRSDTIQISNITQNIVDTNLLIIVRGLPKEIKLQNASGITSGADRVLLPNGDLVPDPSTGDPYIRVFLPNGVLPPSARISQRLVFERGPNAPEYKLHA